MPMLSFSILLRYLVGYGVASLLGAGALANPTSNGLEQLEYQLYRQTYPHQSHSQRLNRLETSVWGRPLMPNESPSTRLEALHQRMRQDTSNDKILLRTLAYLEHRLGCLPPPSASLNQRINHLEALVFGQPQETAQQATDTLLRLSPIDLSPKALPPTPQLTIEQRLERLSQQLTLRVQTIQLVTPNPYEPKGVRP